MWENRPDLLLCQTKQKQQQILKEIQVNRITKTKLKANAYQRLVFHFGGLLCSVGQRLQSRHAIY